MKVLMLAQFYPPVIGGEERHVRNLSVELAARGHEVHVACLDVGQPPVVTQASPCTALRQRRGEGAGALPDRRPAARAADPGPATSRAPCPAWSPRCRPDVVHAHNWIINSYLPLGAARRLPLVYSLHDYSHVCPTKRLMYRGRAVLRSRAAQVLHLHHRLVRRRPRPGHPVDGARRPADPEPGRRRVHAGLDVRRRGQPAHRAGRALAGGPQLRARLAALHGPVPRDPALPAGDYLFFAGDLSEQKGVDTLPRRYAPLEPATRPALLMVGRSAMDLSSLPAGAARRGEVGPRPGRLRLRPRHGPRCCPRSGRTRARPPCSRPWRSARRW